MKIREMDVFFSVPVDRDVLKQCRKAAGFATAKQLHDSLKSKGYSISYRNVELKTDTRGEPKRIRADVAEFLAEVLGVPVTVIFPQYIAAKAAAEQWVDKQYYKPFATIEERNAAIEAAMIVARGAAYKYSRFLRTKQNMYAFSVSKNEIISIAYEVLVSTADRAMRKGIKKGARFEDAVYIDVKNHILRMYNVSQQGSRKAEVYSIEAYTTYGDGEVRDIASPYSLEEQVILRDEVRRAVVDLSEEKRWDKNIQQLIALCFPMGVAAYA